MEIFPVIFQYNAMTWYFGKILSPILINVNAYNFLIPLFSFNSKISKEFFNELYIMKLIISETIHLLYRILVQQWVEFIFFCNQSYFCYFAPISVSYTLFPFPLFLPPWFTFSLSLAVNHSFLLAENESNFYGRRYNCYSPYLADLTFCLVLPIETVHNNVWHFEFKSWNL